MEDALAQFAKKRNKHKTRVLILVLMEDALAPEKEKPYILNSLCLNPCSNGRCTRTGTFLATKNLVCMS